MHRSIHVHAWGICMRKRNARDHRQKRERGRAREGERKRERERESDRMCSVGDDGETPASSQSTWLARCVSVRFVRRLTAWSRRDKARPTLPLGFCSGLISYPPALPEHPRRYAVRGVFRDSHPHTACTYGVRLTTWSSSSALHPPLFSLLRIF